MSPIGKFYCQLRTIGNDDSWDTNARNRVRTSNWKVRFNIRKAFFLVCISLNQDQSFSNGLA